jgi:hypothetical protein
MQNGYTSTKDFASTALRLTIPLLDVRIAQTDRQ